MVKEVEGFDAELKDPTVVESEVAAKGYVPLVM